MLAWRAGKAAGASLYKIRVLPRYAEKSTITSARSAGATSSAFLSTLPKSKRVGSAIQVMGWLGTTTGAGRNPPSVPIWTQLGPTGLVVVSGVGTTCGSVWAAASSVGFRATSLSVPVVGSATYHCRFQKRSLDALRMR